MAQKLKPEQLRHTFDCKSIGCETTAELVAPTTIIGQKRGTQAIEFGISMQSPGYNIYVLGESGTGRTTSIQRFVEKHAANRPAPSDWVYVNNFASPHKPIALELPPGKGQHLSDRMEGLTQELKQALPQAFSDQTFRDAALGVRQQIERQREALFTELNRKAAERGAVVIPSAEGFRIVPAENGQPLPAERIREFSEEEQADWKETTFALQHELSEVLHQARRMEGEMNKEMEELVRRVAGNVVGTALQEIRADFDDLEAEQLKEYFAAIESDIIENAQAFQASQNEQADQRPPEEWFRRYAVNVLVNHAESENAPVVVEYDPTVPRLLGRIEHEARRGGAIVTDFTLLRAGALHAANGGYLVLRAQDLFSEQGAWDALKRSLVGKQIRPDDPAIRRGAATRSLDPEPVPLDVKVILVGPPQLYYFLHQGDEDFESIFKVMADFDAVVERTAENEMAYARFIAFLCEEEALCHLDSEAVGLVVEYGSRLAGTQRKLSTRFGQIADLVRESNYWAKQDNRDVVEREDVRKAIENRRYLRNRVEMSMLDRLMEGKRLVATDGAVVGQINALSVLQVGEHAFGQATRVTTRTFVGKTGVVGIDREVALAGPIHNKGLMTLVGYLGGQYADDHPLSLSAQITFEQNYGGIEGDSASSTELYALLSSLSNLPIKQAIAVTGSVNQLGEVQAIGGVTEKVEGWYSLCKERGLTGEQGAMIPVTNISDLMLREEIVEAVENGRFHVWAVETIDEGIEILMARPAAEVHAAVDARLKELATVMKVYEHGSEE